MNTYSKITGKKYALTNSYFKNRKDDYPDNFLEIVHYWYQHNELPFEYSGTNWIYDCMIEWQKRVKVINSQYITPDAVAKQIGDLSDSFIPKELNVLNACCGIGQISVELMRRGLNVTGLDSNASLVEACRLLYQNAEFYLFDFLEDKQEQQWDLIVSNPPHEQKLLLPFLDWLSNTLSNEGHAILILPQDYFLKSKPAKLVEYAQRFFLDYREGIQESFVYSKIPCEIVVVRLSDNYKSVRQNSIIASNNNLLKNTVMKTNQSETIAMVDLSSIRMNPNNPRRKFKQEDILELAQSIHSLGLLQPITLRPINGDYEIVAGEKRYRAFQHNNSKEIPAIIKDITDEEAFEIALAENLNRSDLSPWDEAQAYQYLLDTGKYKPEDIAARFGKNQSYIRSRLRLLNLTDDFCILLQDEEITLGMAMELSKYSKPIQNEVYREHFSSQESSNWRNLGVKDFSGRMIRLYTMDLDAYSFDKTQCSTCPFNTDTHSLFDQLKGKCTHIECLKKKRDEYTLDVCRKTAVNPNTHVCIAAFDKLDDEIGGKLREEGITVISMPGVECPEPPKEPKRSDFSMEFQYEEAMEKHKMEELNYYADMDSFEQKVDKGEYVRCVYIGDNNPKPAYIPVKFAGHQDKVKDLEDEDKKNKDQTIKSIFKDSLQVLKSNDLPVNSLSVFEEELLFFLMLDFVESRYFKQLGLTVSGKSILTDTEKTNVLQNINDEQRNLIQRAFIVRRLALANLSDLASKQVFYLPEFSRQHFPKEMKEIVNTNMKNYSSKNTKIKDKIKEIEKSLKEVCAEAV